MNPDKFTQQILHALQLDACQQAQMLLDDCANKLLPSFHEELTHRHLEHCIECSALYAEIVSTNARLPALQSLRAPQGFTDSVMARTARGRVASQRKPESQRLRAWLRRPRFALESAYAMTIIVMLFSGLTGVNAIDALDTTLWERASPRLPASTLSFAQLSTNLIERAEQQSEQIATTYGNTTHAIHTWTQEKYAAFKHGFTELLR